MTPQIDRTPYWSTLGRGSQCAEVLFYIGLCKLGVISKPGKLRELE